MILQRWISGLSMTGPSTGYRLRATKPCSFSERPPVKPPSLQKLQPNVPGHTTRNHSAEAKHGHAFLFLLGPADRCAALQHERLVERFLLFPILMPQRRAQARSNSIAWQASALVKLECPCRLQLVALEYARQGSAVGSIPVAWKVAYTFWTRRYNAAASSALPRRMFLYGATMPSRLSIIRLRRCVRVVRPRPCQVRLSKASGTCPRSPIRAPSANFRGPSGRDS